jgi:hypothetical protein
MAGIRQGVTAPTKTAEANSKPAATDTLVNIAAQVLAFRGEEKSALATIARLMNRASGLLRLADLDERLEVENAATVAIAKKHNLLRTD